MRTRHLSDSEPVVCEGCQYGSENWEKGQKGERERETDIIEHDGGGVDEDGRVGRELDGVNVRAVVANVAAVQDVVVLGDVADALHPVPGLVDPLGVRGVAGVAAQAGGDVEEDAVGDGVFVVVAAVGALDLPAHAAVAIGHLPAGELGVEDGLGEGEPLGLVGRRVREVDLGGEQGGHAPEALVVVAQRGGPVGRHVGVDGGFGLEHHGPRGLGVVRVVACVVPVVDEGPPHGAALPPVVRTARRRPGQDAGRLAGFVSVVIRPEVGGDQLGGRLDRVCDYPMSAAVVLLRPRVSRVEETGRGFSPVESRSTCNPSACTLTLAVARSRALSNALALKAIAHPISLSVADLAETHRSLNGSGRSHGYRTASWTVEVDRRRSVRTGQRWSTRVAVSVVAPVEGSGAKECQSEGLAIVWNTTGSGSRCWTRAARCSVHQMVFFGCSLRKGMQLS